MREIKLAGHHLMAIHSYMCSDDRERDNFAEEAYTYRMQMEGYSRDTINNITSILKVIFNSDLRIKLVEGEYDEFCSVCNRKGKCPPLDNSNDQIIIQFFRLDVNKVYTSSELIEGVYEGSSGV